MKYHVLVEVPFDVPDDISDDDLEDYILDSVAEMDLGRGVVISYDKLG